MLGDALTDDIDDVEFELADALLIAKICSYHACRVSDAGVYFREGLRVNDQAELERQARLIVAEEPELHWLQPRLDQMHATFDARERATGPLYVCADDRPGLDVCRHYAQYGSEWLLSLFVILDIRSFGAVACESCSKSIFPCWWGTATRATTSHVT